MKLRKFILILIAAVCVCCVTVLCACDDDYVHNGKVDYDAYGGANSYSAGSFEYTASTVTRVDVEWMMGDITVIQSDSTKLHVTESGTGLSSDKQMRWRTFGSTLEIKFWKSDYTAKVDAADKALTLEIPKELVELKIENHSGSIYADEIDANLAELETVSGSIDLGNVKTVASLALDSSSGAILVDKIDCAGEVELDSESGNISVGLSAARRVEADNDSGNITISLLDNLGATVYYDKTINTQKQYVTSGRSCVFGSGDCFIEVETRSGSLTIN